MSSDSRSTLALRSTRIRPSRSAVVAAAWVLLAAAPFVRADDQPCASSNGGDKSGAQATVWGTGPDYESAVIDALQAGLGAAECSASCDDEARCSAYVEVTDVNNFDVLSASQFGSTWSVEVCVNEGTEYSQDCEECP